MRQTSAKRNGSFIILISLFSLIFTGLADARELTEIARLERGLLPTTLIQGEKPWTLTQRMMLHKVPGVSIAVIKDFKVHWVKGYGYKDISARQPVTATTLFQAASISKPLAAAAALHLVEKGKLKLDANVNEFLETWKLPDNDLTKKTPVTLKMLLSHSGGLTVHGFRGYSASDAIPSLVQVLNGASPANSAPIRVDLEPGTQFRYSGGGFTIVQLMLMDTVKQKFPVIMEDTVLKPLGMTHSSYIQPLPPDRARDAASGHKSNGLPIPGKWHNYPEMAAAGLWTTPGDLAKFAIGIQLSLKGKSQKVLSKQMAQLMLTPYNSPRTGLGLFNSWKGEERFFGHTGGNEGFRCTMTAHIDKGYGAVVMTNSDNGHLLYKEIVSGIANIYNWPGYLKKPLEKVDLPLAKLQSLIGVYSFDSDHMAVVSLENKRLFIRITGRGKAELFAVAGDKFVRKDSASVYAFDTGGQTGKAKGLIIINNRRERTFPRMPDHYMTPLELLLSGKIEMALEAYRKIFKRAPKDPNISGMRLLFLVEDLIGKAKIPEALAMLHLTAELHPALVKNMAPTLNNELRLLMGSPMIPDSVKKQVKDSYNRMLKKLGLKEIE